MTSAILEPIQLKQLHSTGIFDRVFSENKRPESLNSGFCMNSLDSAHESSMMECDNPIIADVPNLYKQNGISVEHIGFFRIPRSVTSDPRYKAAPMKYQKVLHILFEYVAFSPTTHAIGVEIIQLNVGQFCVSESYLAKICNEGVRYEEDLLTKTIVHRAIQFWKKCKIVNQQVNRGKNIITITVPEFYDRCKKESEPASEPSANRPRITKEELKEIEEDNIYPKKAPFVASPFATSLLSEFYSSLFSAIPDFPKESAKKTKTQFQAAESIGKKCSYDMDLIRKVIAHAHTPGGFWLPFVHCVVKLNKKFTTLVTQMRNQGLKPMNGRKPQPKYNFDTSPSLPSKNISFAE